MSRKISVKLIFILTFFTIFIERVFVKFRLWQFFPDQDFLMQPAAQTIEASDDRITWLQNFRQSSKDPTSYLRGFQILAKQTILFFNR